MPTHEVMCQETYQISGVSVNAGLVGISLYERPNSSGLFIVWDPYLSFTSDMTQGRLLVKQKDIETLFLLKTGSRKMPSSPYVQ